MPGLVPGIHDFSAASCEDVDGRDKPGHDKEWLAGQSNYCETKLPTTRLSIFDRIGFCSMPKDLRAAVRTVSAV